MTRSLKERYEFNRITTLQERVKRIDEQILLEHKVANLIVEAMNDEDLNKVTAIVQKLNKIKNPAFPSLKNAIEQAQAELNKYTAGGPITKAWSKMKNLVGIDNPVVKVTTFADALEKGFSQIPKILKNNGIDLEGVDLNKSLATILMAPETKFGSATKAGSATGAKSDEELGNTKFSSSKQEADGPVKRSNDVNIEGKLKDIVTQLQKALSPGGIFGVFKKVPYMNSAELAQELVKAPLRAFSQIVTVVNSGTKAAEVAADMKDQITGQGDVETKNTQTSSQSEPTSQTTPGEPTKDSTTTSNTTSTGEKTSQPQGGGAPQNYAAAKQKLEPLFTAYKNNKRNIDQLVKALVDAGLNVDQLK